jgi:hypothetical protein
MKGPFQSLLPGLFYWDHFMLWVFRLIDVAYCGLVLELPTPLKELSEPSLPLCNSLNTLPSGDSLDKVPPCSHPPEEGE